MCGLAGVIGRQDGESADAVRAMMDCQKHRGPDDRGVFVGKGVAFGHTRLSVIDLSSAGRQPMETSDGRFVIVYNGEVYNFRSLRGSLADRGHSFLSRTDAEVVLHAWAEWGPDSLNRLDGMFAFAVWDRADRTLAVARDRLGIKPLYWHRGDDGSLAFASEVRALLVSGVVAPRLNREVLSDFLAQQTAVTPATLIEGVRMLRPGTWMEVRLEGRNASSPTVTCYWHALDAACRRRVEHELPSQSEMVQGVRDRLTASVEKRLVADAPLGAFLSGGVDSTAVVALMSEARANPVRTFTVAFEDEGFPDGRYGRIAADRIGTSHTQIRLSEKELLERIPQAVAAQDHPSADGINTWVVSQAARESGLTVALSGLGGDELFGGYSSFRRLRTLNRARSILERMPELAQATVSGLARRWSPTGTSEKVSELMSTEGSIAEAYSVLRRVFGTRQRAELLTEEATAGTRTVEGFSRQLREAFTEYPGLSVLSQVSYAEMSCYMRDVLLRDTDQMSMAHSLEVRVPLLDHALVEYVLALPDAVRQPTSPPKRMLVEAVSDILPDPVARREKSGFAMPFARWMKDPLRTLCEEGLESVAGHPCFKASAVWEVWNKFDDEPPRISWSRPWLLVVLGHWLEREGIV